LRIPHRRPGGCARRNPTPMKTFFGSPIPFLARTDDEYVALLRQRVRARQRPKTAAVCYVMLASVFIGICLVFNDIYNNLEILRPISIVSLDEPTNHAFFSMGFYDGAAIIFGLYCATWAIIWFFTRKTVCLLIKYYDKLNFTLHKQSTSSPLPREKITVIQKMIHIAKPFWSWSLKKQTDTEYIESFRKFTPWLTFIIILLGLNACLSAYYPFIFYQQIREFYLETQAIYIGIIFGSIYGLIMAAGAFCLYFAVVALCNYRSERLLVQYYDELNRRPQA